jgi:hypothetical protein
VADQSKVWIGLAYFCFAGDALWRMSDEELIRLGTAKLSKIDIVDEAHVPDGTVLRMDKIREYVDGLENLFLIGRNGMHKYNNQDHSMLTAMVAVDNIAGGSSEKENIWSVYTEQEYHGQK